MSVTPSARRYAFGPFVLDPDESQLRRNGEPVKLAAKAFEMLHALVKRPGRLVTKAELLAEVWPGLFVEEGNLTVHMTELRRALGGDTRHSYIETVPKRGYRFVGDVVEIEGGNSVVLAAPSADAIAIAIGAGAGAAFRDRRRFPWRLVVGAFAVAGMSMGAYVWTGGKAGTPDARFLVVMPFSSLGSGSDPTYLEVGMAEALTARLGHLTSIKVAPIAAIRAREEPFAAAERLGVDAVLTGSVQRQGNRLRVTAQLSNLADRRVIWGDQFNEAAADIFAVQDRIAERIASSLVRGLSAADRRALTRRETVNSDAYDFYLRAREEWTHRTPESVQTAIALYGNAIVLDTGFALAYAGLADAYNISRSGLPAKVRYPLAKAAAEQALALNDGLAEAQTARAFQHYKFEWKWADAEARFRKAIALDPSYALAHHWYAECLFLLGRDAESIAEYRTALLLDPYSASMRHDIARVLLHSGDIAGARAATEAGLKLNLNDAQLIAGLGEVLAAEGREKESVEMRLRAMLIRGTSVAEVDAARAAYRRGGLAAMDLAAVEQLLPKVDKGARQAATQIAQAYARTGNRERTLFWLQRAVALNEDGAIQLRSQKSFDFVRGDPRFQRLLVQVFGE